MRYENTHTDTLSIGRFQVKPGCFLDAIQLTEDEAACLVNFMQRGFMQHLESVSASGTLADIIIEPEPEAVAVSTEPELEAEAIPAEEPEIKRRKRKHADG